MGIRIIKTAIAAIAAIYTAVWLGLEPPLGAGILAILGVEATRKKGITNAIIRFVASVLGLFLAMGVFYLFGFHIWVVAVFILISFSLLSRFQLKDGIVTSAVIAFHLFDRQEFTWQLIGNEVLLLLAGLGWATVINLLYMPGDEKGLHKHRKSIEHNFSVIFGHMAKTLRDPEHIWDGSELLEAGQAIKLGIAQSDRSKENRFWERDLHWHNYYEMRAQQLELVEQMLQDLSFVYERVPQNEVFAELLERLAEDVKSDVYEGYVEQRIAELNLTLPAMELPRTRQEFEVRAALLMIMRELSRFMQIARQLKKEKALID